ncbi:zinc finger protein PLAGL1 isoform X4 [Struthio camelus]|uniref:zinc finger protein PLAGL1 isoform X4 n=1 Tax=Struthio camelus TaxID=8801 RepID=UPI00051E54E9|nr:PREDICTED: zinc finger protein PLAGL1 isoform X3 [Struthio camelus australis]
MSTDLLWCEDCGKSLIGECKLHGPLIRAKDRVIPSRARLTLPHYLTLRVLELRAGNQQILGVFAKKVIQKRTQFGPYVGQLSTKLTRYDESRLVLQVLKDGGKYFLDTPNEDCGNWMMFVRLARNQEEQTLVAYQHCGEVYFTTVKPIEPQTELKVWYAADYAKFMEASAVFIKEESDVCPLSPVTTKEPVDPWICSSCRNAFATFALLESHQCINKDRVLTTRHSATHSPQKSHQCGYCEKTFHRKDHLKNHLQTHDPNKMAFKCEECGKKYNTKLGYKRHLALHAATSGDLTCRVCAQEFGGTEVLLEHLKSHAGKPTGNTKEKKHKCDHCERHFYTRKDVRRHMVVHTGCKDFLCQFCAQRFGRKDHLTRHTRKTHPQELLKSRLQNGDSLGLLDQLLPFRLKEDASLLSSFPDRVSMQNGVLSSSEPEEYNCSHLHSQPNLPAALPLEPAPHLQRMGCVDSLPAVHATPCPTTIPANLNLHQPNKYDLSSTSFAAGSLKNLPIKVDVKGYNVHLVEDLPSSEPQSLHKIHLEEASSGPAGDTSKYPVHKETETAAEATSMPFMDLTHIMSFWQHPPCDNQSATGDITMAFSPEEPSHRLNGLGQQQGPQLATGGMAINQLHHVPRSFPSTTNSVTLPHFHHAFK